MRVAVELNKVNRLLNHGPTVLVASQHGNRRDVMAAAWNMPLDFNPPKVAVVIDKSTYTRELIESSGEFVLCVPCAAQVDLTVAVGHTSGRNINKFERYGIRSAPGQMVDAPLIEGCLAWLECVVFPEPSFEQRYDLFLAEVVAAWADDQAFVDGQWLDKLPLPQRSLHHLGGGHFFTSTGRLQGKTPTAA